MRRMGPLESVCLSRRSGCGARAMSSKRSMAWSRIEVCSGLIWSKTAPFGDQESLWFQSSVSKKCNQQSRKHKRLCTWIALHYHQGEQNYTSVKFLLHFHCRAQKCAICCCKSVHTGFVLLFLFYPQAQVKAFLACKYYTHSWPSCRASEHSANHTFSWCATKLCNDIWTALRDLSRVWTV